MNGDSNGHSTLGDCLRRFRAGEIPANDVLVAAGERFCDIAHRLKRRFPWLGRWVETDDVVQGAMLRLTRALAKVSLDSTLDFLRFTAALIRRELIDLARHFSTMSRLHQTPPLDSGEVTRPYVESHADGDAESLAAWADFHESVGGLPEEQLAVFDLLWYHGMTQAEAADELGVSLKTVKRRWQDVRFDLYDAMDGHSPK